MYDVYDLAEFKLTKSTLRYSFVRVRKTVAESKAEKVHNWCRNHFRLGIVLAWTPRHYFQGLTLTFVFRTGTCSCWDVSLRPIQSSYEGCWGLSRPIRSNQNILADVSW